MNGPTKVDTYNVSQKKFVDGMTNQEKLEETIRMKGDKGMETYNTLLQLQEDPAPKKMARPAGLPVRGEKQW